ncbi:MAG: GFA family protein [Comamonadaceae bacterium]|nr:MAG: GFA family protein [Comamonadaceae bacterium]
MAMAQTGHVEPAVREGGCLCGALRYRVTGQPLSHSVCFCRQCRLSHAAGSVAWFAVSPDQFQLVQGELSTYRSSPGVYRRFCPVCGSAIVFADENSPGEVEITTATLDDPDALMPTREVWLSQRVAWAESAPGLRHHPRASWEGT